MGTVFAGRYVALQGAPSIAENDFLEYYPNLTMANRW